MVLIMRHSQNQVQEALDKLKNVCATQAQRIVRGFLSRKLVSTLRMHRAAVKIQLFMLEMVHRDRKHKNHGRQNPVGFLSEESLNLSSRWRFLIMSSGSEC